jgi:hypothetical protein
MRFILKSGRGSCKGWSYKRKKYVKSFQIGITNTHKMDENNHNLKQQVFPKLTPGEKIWC